MGLLDKAKSAAEQAAAKAKEGVEDVQAKRELAQAYGDLGKTTFDLIESGALSNPGLEAAAARVRAAKAATDGGTTAPPAAPSPPYDSSQPPAMPS
jgi:hypothetical protein